MTQEKNSSNGGISLLTILIFIIVIVMFSFAAFVVYQKSMKNYVESEIKAVNKSISLLEADKEGKLSDKDILSMSGFSFTEKENREGEVVFFRSNKKSPIKIIKEETKGIEIMYELNIYNEFVNFYRNEENLKKYKMKSNCDVIKREMACNILITAL